MVDQPPDVLGGLADVGRVFFSFPEVLDPARHRDYNAWHQLDHLPQNRALPGVRHGERWVRTPRCREASWRSADAAADDFDAAQYVAMYWFADPVEASVREWFRLGEQTEEIGRRPEVAWTRRRFTGFANPTGGAAADGVAVTAGAVPFLPHAGVVLEVGVEATRDVAELAVEPGVLGAWAFAGTGRHEGLSLTLSWCAADPVGVSLARSRTDGLLLRTGLEVVTPGAWDWFDA